MGITLLVDTMWKALFGELTMVERTGPVHPPGYLLTSLPQCVQQTVQLLLSYSLQQDSTLHAKAQQAAATAVSKGWQTPQAQRGGGQEEEDVLVAYALYALGGAFESQLRGGVNRAMCASVPYATRQLGVLAMLRHAVALTVSPLGRSGEYQGSREIGVLVGGGHMMLGQQD
jgi:hypothetical protein